MRTSKNLPTCAWKTNSFTDTAAADARVGPQLQTYETVGRGQDGRKSVQASECLVCLLKQWQELLERERWIRRQRRRHIGPEGLVFEGLDDISPERLLGLVGVVITKASFR
jgi:hypothetical protein